MTENALRPQRRPLPLHSLAEVRNKFSYLDAQVTEVAITASDGISLKGWYAREPLRNAPSVIVLHGLGDNRLGMMGYAELLLAHGFNVLMPDARAHGESGGTLATYGLLERNDIREWYEWLAASENPACIFGLGESMGAAQLLQALEPESQFCAVIAESSFSSFREIAYDRAGQFFHTGPWLGRTLLRPLLEWAFWYARLRYGLRLEDVSPESAVAATHIPVLLIHGLDDTNIPIRHSRLIQRRNSDVRLWEVAGAGHCGAISTSPRVFEQRVLGWFKVSAADIPAIGSPSIKSCTSARQ